MYYEFVFKTNFTYDLYICSLFPAATVVCSLSSVACEAASRLLQKKTTTKVDCKPHPVT